MKSRAWMNSYSCFLVNDKDVIILIYDIKRYILSFKAGKNLFIVFKMNFIVSSYFRAFPHHLAIDCYDHGWR